MEVKEPAPKYYPKMSPPQFLEWERKQEDKHEYMDGKVFAMAGASYNHNCISSNIHGRIWNYLLDKPCNIFGSDLRISVKWMNSYFYTDAVIICDEPDFDDTKIKDTVKNPVVIFEVFSPDEDMIRKLMYYMQIESLKQYLIIDSRKIHLKIITKRTAEGTWKYEEFTSLSDKIFIEPISFETTLENLYKGVEF